MESAISERSFLMLSSFLSVLPDPSAANEAFSKGLDLIISLLEDGDSTASNLLTAGMKEFNTTYALVMAGITLVLALAGCFFGYKLSRLFMTLTGFLAGLFIGAFVAVKFLDASNMCHSRRFDFFHIRLHHLSGRNLCPVFLPLL